MDAFTNPYNSQAFFGTQILWSFSIPAVKILILTLYVRIFGNLRYSRIAAIIIGVFSVLWGAVGVFTVSPACRPFEYN